MSFTFRLAAAALAAAGLPAGPAQAAPVRNVLPNSAFEAKTSTWTPTSAAIVRRQAGGARSGRYSISVTALGNGIAGVSLAAQPAVLQRRGFLSPVTHALRGTFTGSAWVRALGHAGGELLRAQLNEFGGATAEGRLAGAVTSVRLGSGWQRVTVKGSVLRPDRIGVTLVLALDDAARGQRFLVDDARIGGDPLGGITIPRTGRWHWWTYALVWVLVLSSGAAWLVVPRRRRKTTAVRSP